MQIDAKLEKYKKIFVSLKNSFDYIILDTPQYPMYSESLSLSSIVDLTISVVKLNHTPVKVSGKHFRDMASFSKKHIILINNDLIDINSSGYTFVDKSNVKHKFVRIKQKISQI
jgi:Mrp family chromosome partitioning ATPase